MVADTAGRPYRAFHTLAEAQADSDGIVVFEARLCEGLGSSHGSPLQSRDSAPGPHSLGNLLEIFRDGRTPTRQVRAPPYAIPKRRTRRSLKPTNSAALVSDRSATRRMTSRRSNSLVLLATSS
jgi:hypothetical protein